ncbi:CidA/LrgA family protein [Streptobacillus canis]|uniref:CidA/LrgA family protein n=1 Tax=Streptobacillus canis TaxID=2678686 RepID=UPI0012E1B8D8|nr:CidA/LrgA family protein [Streptobacillus canis]
MKIIKQLAYILAFSYIGVSISKITNIPVPGSVIGLILFFMALQFKLIRLEKVEETSRFLTENLAVLFIPAGVAIMISFKYIKDSWMIILGICLITTIISLIFTGKLVQYLINKGEGK